MTKNKWYWIIGLIIIGAIILPFILSDNQNSNLNISASLVSAVGSLITLLIALILYDKYGLKTDLVKSQTDTVLEQLKRIKTVNFLIWSNDEGFLQFFPTKDRTEAYEMFYSHKLVFSTKYWNYMNSIFEISSSLYMPKNIINKINYLKPSLISFLKKEELKNYSKVTFWGEKDDNVEYGKINGSDITFKEFYQYWTDLLDEISDWLSDKIDINNLNIEN